MSQRRGSGSAVGAAGDVDRPADELRLRPLLVRALGDDGFGAACRGEPRSHIDIATSMSYIVMPALGLGAVSAVADWFDTGTWGWFGILLIATAAAVIGAYATSPHAAARTLAQFWGLALGIQLLASDHDVLETLVWPFAVSAVLLLLLRRRRLSTVARVSPLLLPVTLTVLLIPLFTDDLWSAAEALRPRHFLLLAALTLLPLVVFLGLRLRREVPEVFKRAREDIRSELGSRRDEYAERATARLVRLAPDEDKEQVRSDVGRELEGIYADIGVAELTALEARLVASLRRQVVIRLLWTTVGLLIGVTAYLYALAWILVPVGVSSDWIGGVAHTTTVDLLAFALQAPLGAYVSLSVLLGVVATAVLLGLGTTEERYAGDFTAAVLYTPMRDGLIIALPYERLAADDPVVPD